MPVFLLLFVACIISYEIICIVLFLGGFCCFVFNSLTESVGFYIVKDDKSIWNEIEEHAVRFAMMPRNVSVRWRKTNSLSIPLFAPEIGNVFGQSNSYGPMAPGLDFAFGFVDEGYIYDAKDRGWLICDNDQTSPAMWVPGAICSSHNKSMIWY